MLKEHINRITPNETPENIIPIMTYELGDLAKCLMFAKRRPQLEKEYKAEARIATSDLVAQCIVMCERLGWDFYEVVHLGEDRCIEKIKVYEHLIAAGEAKVVIG